MVKLGWGGVGILIAMGFAGSVAACPPGTVDVSPLSSALGAPPVISAMERESILMHPVGESAAVEHGKSQPGSPRSPFQGPVSGRKSPVGTELHSSMVEVFRREYAAAKSPHHCVPTEDFDELSRMIDGFRQVRLRHPLTEVTLAEVQGAYDLLKLAKETRTMHLAIAQREKTTSFVETRLGTENVELFVKPDGHMVIVYKPKFFAKGALKKLETRFDLRFDKGRVVDASKVFGVTQLSESTGSMIGFEREIRVFERLSKLREEGHPLPGLTHAEVIHARDLDGTGRTLLFQKHYEKGDLGRAISRGGFSREQSLKWISGIAQGLDSLHRIVGRAHMDVKPENVLIDSEGRAYLNDFGNSVGRGSPIPKLTSKGYESPEMVDQYKLPPRSVKNEADAEGVKARDVYSFGIVMAKLLRENKTELETPLERCGGKWAGTKSNYYAKWGEGAYAACIKAEAPRVHAQAMKLAEAKCGGQGPACPHLLMARSLDPDPAGRPSAWDLSEAFAAYR